MPTPPWKQKKPRIGATKTKLTEESIKWASERARLAGRRYPNLVDNMAAAARQREADAGSDADRSRP